MDRGTLPASYLNAKRGPLNGETGQRQYESQTSRRFPRGEGIADWGGPISESERKARFENAIGR